MSTGILFKNSQVAKLWNVNIIPGLECNDNYQSENPIEILCSW